MRIEVDQLTKKYRNKLALDNVSFVLEEPNIYGLLGRNGAGKTTFMNMLAGHQEVKNGTIQVNGKNPFNQREILKDICLIKETDNFYKDIKVKQVLKIYQLFYPKWDQELAMEMIRMYKLPLSARVKALSKGMASALGVTVGLASRAAITIFDEPYIGMDAAARKRFYDILLDEYEKEPRTIIFSTHLIDEVSMLFEEVLILQEGKLILQHKTDVLREQTYAVTGSTAEVQQFVAEKQVMKTEKLANMMTAYVYGDRFATKDAPDNLTFEGIPIQDTMIYLTDTEVAACN